MTPGASELDRAVEIFVGNPFAATREVRDEAQALLVGADDIGTHTGQELERGDLAAAMSTLLAVGHARACAGHAAEDILGADLLPAPILASLPRGREAYVRLALAAGRCTTALAQIRGDSEAMQRARRETWAACFGDSLLHALDLERVIVDHDVLILGETGTGKELFAEAIQRATPGDGTDPAPRSAINAAAIPDTLVESELFGHVVGAFTGATESRPGRLRSADGGSFFLDEVGDLPQTTQVKLLRVMETNEIFPVGSDAPVRAQVRYIAATHKNLEELALAGAFRRDLFERLAGVVLRIPPLRDRPEDIQSIGEHFVASYLHGSRRVEDANRVLRWLRSSEARDHRWPGNVRELQNALRNILLGLPVGLRWDARTEAPADETPAAVREGSATLDAVEDWYVRKILRACEGNYTRAAQILGVDRSTVRRKLKG